MSGSIISRIPDLEALTYSLFQEREGRARGRKYFQVGDVDGNPGKSCTVWPAEGRFHDFNGDVGGDVVDLLRHRLNTDVAGVARWLQDNGWMTREAPRRPPPAPPPAKAPKLRLLDIAPPNAALPSQDTLLAAYRANPEGNPLSIVEGAPIPAHLYCTADGDGVLLVIRYPVIRQDDRHDKAVRRWSWSSRSGWWRAGGTSNALLPLYRLPALAAADPGQPILVVEGERTAETAAQMTAFSRYLATCAVGGSSPAPGTDWKPVAGHPVYVLPDADLPGNASRSFPRKVLEATLKAGATYTQIVNPQIVFERLGGSGTPPKGWDVADAEVDCPPLNLSEMAMTLDQWRRAGARTPAPRRPEASSASSAPSAADLLRQGLAGIFDKAAAGEYGRDDAPKTYGNCVDCGGPLRTPATDLCTECEEEDLSW